MRIGKSVYLSSRIDIENAETPTYENPIEIVTRPNYFTVMPSNARNDMEVLKSGETIYKTWIATANNKYFEKKAEFLLGFTPLGEGVFADKINFGDYTIKVGDLMWVDGEEPIEDIENEYGVGSSATAEVKSISKGNLITVIRLERNQRQVK